MKVLKSLLPFGLLALATAAARAQTTKQEVEDLVKTQLAPVKDQTKELQAKLTELTDKLDEAVNREKAGKFWVTSVSSIPIYVKKIRVGGDSMTTRTIDIKEIKLDCQDGLVYDIQVITTAGRIFTNTRASIPISHFGGQRNDNLFDTNTSSDYIQCADFLRWIRYTDVQPDDANFSLSRKDEEKELARHSGIDQVINLRLYSDLLGVFGEKANGLVQTEATFRSVVRETNFRNSSSYFIRDIRLDFMFARLDKKLQSTYYQVADANSFARASLYQRAYLNAEFQINLLNTHPAGHKKSFYLDFPLAGGVSLSNLAAVAQNPGTAEADTSTRTVNLPYLMPSIQLGGRLGSNAGYRFAVKLLFQSGRDLSSLYGAAAANREFLIFEPEVFFNPLGSPASRFFARLRYNEMVKSSQSFFQAQVGYTFSLSQALSKRTQNAAQKTDNKKLPE